MPQVRVTMLYNTLKFLHILLTIIAVGYSMTFGLILSRAAKASQNGRELKYALQTVRVMSTIANVCFVLLALLGVALVHVGGYSWAPIWIHGSAALFLITLALGIFVLGPMAKRRLTILESRGPSDPEFIKLSKRSAMLGGIAGLITLTIIWLMVAKPV
jgi:uncharacterized membrane protein